MDLLSLKRLLRGSNLSPAIVDVFWDVAVPVDSFDFGVVEKFLFQLVIYLQRHLFALFHLFKTNMYGTINSFACIRFFNYSRIHQEILGESLDI